MKNILKSFLILLSYCTITNTKSINNNNNSLIYPNMQFRVCGAYCGPGWCNNQWLFENDCNTTVEPEHHIITGDSCADTCCQMHDRCCGQDKYLQRNCNRDIINCLSKCNPFSLSCTFGIIPIPAEDIEIGMSLVENRCCSSKCEDNDYDEIISSIFN